MIDSMKILIVDDEPFIIDQLEQELEDLGYQTISAANGKDALDRIVDESSDHGFPGILVTDIRMPMMDGLELMKHTQEHDPDLPVVLATAYGDISMAVKAIQDGAYDFIEKPIRRERIEDVIKHAMEKRLLILENRALRSELAIKSGMDARIIGNSSLIIEIRESIANLADTNACVLLLGETGTGKELVARCLHDYSTRSKHNFVPVNCGAIPENLFESELFGYEAGAFTGATKRHNGKFEHANNGTLFLDEIESIPLNLQVKLLRVLEEHVIERLGSNEQIPVNFRVVAATKTDLKNMAKEGDFREDLYYRLNVAEVLVPSLRDRREDIPLLFNYFAEQLSAQYERESPRLSGSDNNDLMSYSWPGNVRELKNVAERYVLGLTKQKSPLSRLINPSNEQHLNLPEQVKVFERYIIENALTENKGNIQLTMETLGIPRRTLNDKMRFFNLDRKKYI